MTLKEACEYIYTYLGSEHKSKNITPANLVYLRDDLDDKELNIEPSKVSVDEKE